MVHASAEEVGAKVFVPDFFQGEHAPFDIFADKSIQMDPDFDFMGLLKKNNRCFRHPLIVPAINTIKSLYRVTSIGPFGVLPRSA
jgi:hypothetical protein